MNGAGDKSIPELFREIAQENRSGLLRLTAGKSIKAIFFEGGVPVFGISNQPSEQLDYVLVNNGIATNPQIDQAKAKADKPHKLGQALIEMGVAGKSVVDTATIDLAKQIILSVFEWTKAESAFDERVRAVHDVKIPWTATDCILEGVRRASGLGDAAQALIPDDAVLIRSKKTQKLASTGRLTPTESYVLSRIDSEVQASEVASMTGLGDEDSRRALCSLVALGLLRIQSDDVTGEEGARDQSIADLEEDLSRKLHFFASADHYEVLGVTKRSSTAEIKAAYYKLAKKYHPDRYRQQEDNELRVKLETVFSRISQAWNTLGDGAQRALYDDQMKKSGKLDARAGTQPITHSAPIPQPLRPAPAPQQSQVSQTARPAQPAQPSQPARPDAEPKPAIKQNGTGELKEPAAAAAGTEAHAAEDHPKPAGNAQPMSIGAHAGAAANPAQAAEFYFQQSRVRVDQKDYYGAVQLLREAVRLDPSKAPYHFHLGMNLMKNPRTRREGEYHLTRAAQLDPYNAQVRVKIGMMYKEAGLGKKAEQLFREALSLDPNNRNAQKELGEVSTSKKDEPSIWKSDLGSIAKRFLKK
jgi:curved DNA-binding protein CbpA